MGVRVEYDVLRTNCSDGGLRATEQAAKRSPENRDTVTVPRYLPVGKPATRRDYVPEYDRKTTDDVNCPNPVHTPGRSLVSNHTSAGTPEADTGAGPTDYREMLETLRGAPRSMTRKSKRELERTEDLGGDGDAAREWADRYFEWTIEEGFEVEFSTSPWTLQPPTVVAAPEEETIPLLDLGDGFTLFAPRSDVPDRIDREELPVDA